MDKRLIRLTESDLHRIVKESVNKILKETRYAWDLTDDGVKEYPMDGNWPADHWDNEHNWNRNTSKGASSLKVVLPPIPMKPTSTTSWMRAATSTCSSTTASVSS